MVSSATNQPKGRAMFDYTTGTIRPDFIDTAPITGTGKLAQRWAEEQHGLRITSVEVEEQEEEQE